MDADVDTRGDLSDVARARTQLRVSAREVRLPDTLASRVSAELELEGDLKVPTALHWTSHLELKKASLAGWTALACCAFRSARR